MAAPTQDKTAWRIHLMRGNPVDVLDRQEDKWLKAVVIECNKPRVEVMFLDTRGRESQWLSRHSSRLAPPASQMALKPEPTATTRTSGRPSTTVEAGSCGEEERAPRRSGMVYDCITQGSHIEVADTNSEHWYEVRVLVRTGDRVLVCLKGWPLSHVEWFPVTSSRLAFFIDTRRLWRGFKMGQQVQIGSRTSQDGFGASHWANGTVVSLWSDESRLFLVEIEWHEPSGAKKCEWRAPQDDLLARPGLPMPCVDDDGVVTMTQTIQGEETTTQLPSRLSQARQTTS